MMIVEIRNSDSSNAGIPDPLLTLIPHAWEVNFFRESGSRGGMSSLRYPNPSSVKTDSRGLHSKQKSEEPRDSPHR
jgi:hypothetical protein